MRYKLFKYLPIILNKYGRICVPHLNNKIINNKFVKFVELASTYMLCSAAITVELGCPPFVRIFGKVKSKYDILTFNSCAHR